MAWGRGGTGQDSGAGCAQGDAAALGEAMARRWVPSACAPWQRHAAGCHRTRAYRTARGTWPSLGASEAGSCAGGARQEGLCSGGTGAPYWPCKGCPASHTHSGPNHPPASSRAAGAPRGTAGPAAPGPVRPCVPQECPVAGAGRGRSGWNSEGEFFFLRGVFFLKPKPAPRAFQQVPTATIWSIKINLACLAAPVCGGRGGGGGWDQSWGKKAPSCSDV